LIHINCYDEYYWVQQYGEPVCEIRSVKVPELQHDFSHVVVYGVYSSRQGLRQLSG